MKKLRKQEKYRRCQERRRRRIEAQRQRRKEECAGVADGRPRNRIKNLVILNNGAHAHLGHNKYRSLSTEFGRTIIYWEVTRGG